MQVIAFGWEWGWDFVTYSLERGFSDLGSGEVLLGSFAGSFVDGGSAVLE